MSLTGSQLLHCRSILKKLPRSSTSVSGFREKAFQKSDGIRSSSAIPYVRLKPPRLPPRPKRMLGGTNFKEDMVEVSVSTASSAFGASGDLAVSVVSDVTEGSGEA